MSAPLPDDTQERSTPPAPAPDPVTLRPWRYIPDAWRVARRVDVRYVDMVFRARSARVLPASARARFIEMGIPADVVADTLGRIRRANQWSAQWIETAQGFLGESRRQVSAMNVREAAQARQTAALCYHAAQIFEIFDRRTMIKSRAAAASLFTQTLPVLYPNVRHMWIPWRSSSLPALFQMPDPVVGPAGLVVILNGTSMSKEETLRWHDRFLDEGYAVMSLDSPGTGEASSIAGATSDQDDVLDGIFAIFENEPMIDLTRVIALGASLGGNQAVRAIAHDRRILAAVAVTPPYEPARWLDRANPLLIRELELMVDEDSIAETRDRVAEFSLEQAVDASRQPMLVFGGGRDILVPPNEAQLLAERAGERATFAWYSGGGHCLFEMIDKWTFEAATWIHAIGDVPRDRELAREPGRLAAIGQDALESSAYEPRRPVTMSLDEPDFTEYARLLPDDERDGKVE